ncbi:hypothetical protein V6N11_059282 [Hibiscus sabdariffa]|uniref:Uncharacterized protein n=1 Tax=Hibiscus sabdariffa TaxID=183260 RepID=A0ABR2U6Q0_9ROSI
MEGLQDRLSWDPSPTKQFKVSSAYERRVGVLFGPEERICLEFLAVPRESGYVFYAEFERSVVHESYYGEQSCYVGHGKFILCMCCVREIVARIG